MKRAERKLARRIRWLVRVKKRKGEITSEQARRLEEGSRDAGVVRRWRTTLEQEVVGAPWVDNGLKTGPAWDSILKWILDNWPTILKVLLSLLVFLGERPNESDLADD